MDFFVIDKIRSAVVRRLVAFFSLVLLVLSVVALGNQPEFQSGTSSRSNLGTTRDPGNETGRGPIIPPNFQEPPEPQAPAELDGVEVLSESRPPNSVPPKPGRYRYRFTARESRRGERSEQTFEIVVTVAKVSASDTETRLIHTTFGGGSPLKHEVSWTSGEMLHLRWFSDGEDAFNCDWDPDLVQLKLPLERSSQWRIRSECDGTAGSGSQRIQNEEEALITDAVRARVAGTTIQGWRLERNSNLTSTSNGASETQTRSGIQVFSPVHGLVVKSIFLVYGTSPSGTATEREEIMELLNLEPA